MLDAMNIAATGMRTQQLNVDTIANNLANVNTMGYKKSRVNFTDLVTQGADAAAAAQAASTPGLPALDAQGRLGAGVGVSHVDKVFDGGEVRKTGNALDIAIAGDGFLEVTLPDGSTAYTRGGTLKVTESGLLATADGHVLRPEIQVPSGVQAIAIDADGKVRITTQDGTQPVEAGQLSMARFANPGALTALGANVFAANETSGEAIDGHAGQDGMGAVQQGFLEASNVKMVDEMVGLMMAQRAYEASVKVVQASDEMMGLVNNLRR